MVQDGCLGKWMLGSMLEESARNGWYERAFAADVLWEYKCVILEEIRV